MRPQTADTPPMRRLFAGATVLASLIVVVLAIPVLVTGQDVFADAGNDDIMRMMSVRDWLAGQGWFDMTQHRLLPPEGLSLHWSRYVDAGIGALVAVFNLVLLPDAAERLAGVIWPVLLSLLLIATVATSTRRLFGPAAGGIAALMVACYPPLVMGYFVIGHLDHHNLQILLMTVAVLLLARDDRPARHGAIAGLAAAMSLAIGLETLFMVVGVSLLHVVDAAVGREGGRARLGLYCGALLFGGLMLFVGQTPVAEWSLPYCDELGLPLITLTAIGCGAAIVGLAIPAARGRPLLFFGSVACAAALGLIAAWPMLSHCLQPPYANLPVETRTMISATIMEAEPLLVLLHQFPTIAYSYFGPALAVLVLATIRFARTRDTGGGHAVAYLLAIGWLGVIASFWQMRQVVILATVVPVLTGYVVAPVLRRRLALPTRRSQLALYAVCALTLFQPVLLIAAEATFAASQAAAEGDVMSVGEGTASTDEACNDTAQLASLNALPPATILTSTNLGPRLIMATHHSGLAAPYHRSNAAFTNGFILRLSEADAVLARMAEVGADMLVVCKGSLYAPDSIGTRLARGETVPGFRRVPLAGTDVMAFRPEGGT